ncbi:L-type lectin-domain containing receptor kinase VIII.1-like [Cornus florida]|uniref:L-type lectin-domain containing receptor kinase VIII.1-like n=1 Tax=Cornus florida TaxID=4283 RepID=UPI00289B1451|nr:L-type lectin-domain containing receptor kinase VIII.1-like [Cornus florida]
MSSLSYEFSGIIFVTFFLLLCFSGNVVGTTEFDFGTLTLSSLKLLGDAHLSNGTVRLTRDLAVPNSGSGRVLYSKPVRFRQPGSDTPTSFSTFFSFSVANLNPSSIGGGLAFVISPDDETIGGAGGFLGLMDDKGTPNGVVAVEFDTLMDVEFKDINGNHVGLDLNSMVSSQVGDLETIEVDLKSGDLINSWVEYSGSTRVFNISVSYSNLKPKEPLLSFNLDLDQYVNDFMFVGFSGSTQGSTEVHSVEWWSFSSSFDVNSKSGPSSSPLAAEVPPPPPPTVNLMNPTANSIIPTPPSMAPSESNSTAIQTQQKNSKCHNQLCKQGPGAVAGVVTAGAFVLAFFAILFIWVYSKKFKNVKPPETMTSEIIKMPKEFSYKELKSATKFFNSTRIIGHGAFGTVYKGILPETGDIVAVKRCSHSGQGKAEFLSELSIIGTLRHRNLVRLQGWCHEKGEILLVYDMMSNGSLDKALFESRMPLPWPHRRKILMGVASALTYLHQECENQVIHRDVKTSNIMLDEGFNAKLGDFGLARQIEHDRSPDATVAAGTMGYLAPEYLLTGRANEKTDVFSYGAVALEVASGRRPIERESSGVGKVGVCSNLVEWVWSLHREGRLLMAADSRLGGEFEEGEMRRVLLIGLACSHPDPLVRPTMRGVFQMLVGETEVPIVPRTKPSMSFSTSHLLLSLQDSVSDINGLITISTSSSEHSFTGGVEFK